MSRHGSHSVSSVPLNYLREVYPALPTWEPWQQSPHNS